MEYKSFIKDEISSYLLYKRKSVSDSTLKKTEYILKNLDEFLFSFDVEKIEILSELMVMSWFNSAEHNGENRKRIYALNAYNDFARYINRKGGQAFIIDNYRTIRDYKPYIFDKTELSELIRFSQFRAVRSIDPMKDGTLAFAIYLEIAVITGMRKSEILSIKNEDIDAMNKTVTVNHGKGNKDRAVPLPDDLYNHLYNYVFVTLSNRPGFIFSNNGKEKYSQTWVDSHYKEILNEAKINNTNSSTMNIHCLRHTFATLSFMNAVENKKDLNSFLQYLSVYLGHESISETEYYIHIGNKMNHFILESMDKDNREIYEDNII